VVNGFPTPSLHENEEKVSSAGGLKMARHSLAGGRQLFIIKETHHDSPTCHNDFIDPLDDLFAPAFDDRVRKSAGE
jgi:hypothetical protein